MTVLTGRGFDLCSPDGRSLLFRVKRPRRERGEGGEIPPPPFQTDRTTRPTSMTLTKGEA